MVIHYMQHAGFAPLIKIYFEMSLHSIQGRRPHIKCGVIDLMLSQRLALSTFSRHLLSNVDDLVHMFQLWRVLALKVENLA